MIEELNSLKKLQKDYHQLLLQRKGIFSHTITDKNLIPAFIEEVNGFWLERIERAEYDLKQLTEKESCFLLSGAIHLKSGSLEPYIFKSLGKYQVLFDPILKLTNFFSQNREIEYVQKDIDNFLTVFFDTLSILENYPNQFFILPVDQISCKNFEEHIELMRKGYLGLLGSLVNQKFENEEDFIKNFKTFDQIEKSISKTALSSLIFLEDEQSNLNLKQKINNYTSQSHHLAAMTTNKTEAEIFLICLRTYIYQVFDILITSLKLRVVPYIRYQVTFQYFYLISHSFENNKEINLIVEKMTIAYVFSKTMSRCLVDDISFEEYTKKIESIDLVEIFLKSLREKKLNILEGNLLKLEKIIQDKMSSVLEIQ